jgi:hypothetical protein
MPIPSSHAPALPAAWTEMLDQIQRALAETLEATLECERRLEPGDVTAASERQAAWSRLLQQLQPLTERTEALAGRPEQTARATAEALESAQAELDQWLAKAAEVGQRLADLAGRAV